MNDRTSDQTPADVLANILPWIIGYFVVGLVLWIAVIGYLALTAKSRSGLDDAFDSSYALLIPLWPIVVIVAPIWLIERLQDRLKAAIIRWRKF